MRKGAYVRGGGGGTYTRSKTSVKEKEGLSEGGRGYRQRNTVYSPAPL